MFAAIIKTIYLAIIVWCPLVGIKGCAIIGHGKSNPKAIKNAIFQAINYVNTGVNEHIEARLEALNK